MKCLNCKSSIDNDSWYCDQCGTKIYVCPECHVPGKGEGKRCGMCGSKLIAAVDLAGEDPQAQNARQSQQQTRAGQSQQYGQSQNQQSRQARYDQQNQQPRQPKQPEYQDPPKPKPATRLVCRQENITLNLQNGAVLGRLEGPYQSMLCRLEYVSARHAQLWAEGDHWIISDLGSRNGTAVNGEWCYNPLPFRQGDIVRLANYYDFIAE